MGNMNVVADALSRKLGFSLMKFHDDWKEQFGVEYTNNQFAYDLFYGLINYYSFNILNDTIYHNGIIFLVP